MNCGSCGLPLQPGATFCTSCGAPVSYNAPGQNSSPPYDPAAAPSPYNPTVMANPPSYDPSGAPSPYNPTVMANPPSYDPTVAVPSPYNQPPTAYGAPSNPYENPAPAPAQDPYNPYNAAASPYGAPAQPPNAYPAYGYGNPPAGPGTFTPGVPGTYGTPAPKRNRTGLIIGIAVLALLLVCGGLFAMLMQLGKNTSQSNRSSNATATTTTGTGSTTGTTSTSSTTTTGSVPSTSSIVPAAAQIISNPQTASAIDNNFQPTQVTSTFTAGQSIYLTFDINSNGHDGYVQVKWYEDGQLLDSPILHHHAQNDRGYFSIQYNDAGSGAAAMYWCTQPDCSDGQLAQVVTFTVTG